MKYVSTIMLCTLLSFFANAQDNTQSINDYMTKVKSQLNLTEEQQANIEPIMSHHIDKVMDVVEKYGIKLDSGSKGNANDLSFSDMRKLGKEISKVREDTQQQLAIYLTPQQLEVYEKLQDERKKAMRKRLRNR